MTAHDPVATSDGPSPGRRRGIIIAALALAVVAVAAIVVVVVKSGGHATDKPSASATGMFPATWVEPGKAEVGHIAGSAANAPGDESFDFTVTTPKDSPTLFVIQCDRGTISDSAGSSTNCTGTPHGLGAPCAGGTFKFSVTVSQPQSRAWGIAAYREPASLCAG